MKETRFSDLSPEEQEWIDALIEGSIDEASFERLQAAMLKSPELRQVVRRSLALHHDLTEQAMVASEGEPWLESEDRLESVVPFPQEKEGNRFVQLAMAASIAFLLGLALMHFGSSRPGEEVQVAAAPSTQAAAEPSATGFAVIENLIGVEWAEGQVTRSEGDSLGAEVLRMQAGVAEIQFFSGAKMVVEGPAEIEFKSAWEATCRQGILRMRVPPAARGFRLLGPETEIEDLGTEFGFEVREGKAHLEVLEGEVSFKHRDAGEQLVQQGGAWNLPAGGDAVPETIGQVAFPDSGEFTSILQTRREADFNRWQTHRDALSRDASVIAYYTFDHPAGSRLIPCVAQPANSELDGAVILAETTAGRWPGYKQALEFRRAGSRVRVRIPGEFPAFTFAAWVRIDSLDRRYNALFMGDGYETGEPHWQIRDDGKLMLSVMVDDTRPNPWSPDDAGFHRVYFSPPIWNPSLSGQWMHLVSIFDPSKRQVSHFVNGESVSSQEIEPDYLIETLRIGNGEIGNWGQPFRETPWFAIRHLNGRIDELAIFKRALSEAEVRELYDSSKAGSR